jgi:arylsulfatase A-like enzyme
LEYSKKHFILNGLLSGIILGLVTTFFDSLFMLQPIYLPESYPLDLILFNIIFWAGFGGTAGMVVSFFTSGKDTLSSNLNTYWTLGYLLPFALIYGGLSRVFLPGLDEKHYPWPIFDYHLSFVWVALFVISLAWLGTKKQGRETVPSLPFIPETITIILLFQFCSNTSFIVNKAGSFFFSSNPELWFSFSKPVMILIYITGIVLTSFGYLGIRLLRPLSSSRTSLKVLLTKAVFLLIIISAWVGGLSWLNESRYTAKKNSVLTLKQNAVDSTKVPFVILIVLDTLRADRLSIYGKPGRTENLAAFSKDCLVFENAIASSSWTVPSHASLFTGLYPVEHGTHSTFGNGHSAAGLMRPLNDKFNTLAEVFQAQGYKTAGISANLPVLHPGVNLAQGFQFSYSISSIGSTYLFFPFKPIIHLFSDITHFRPQYSTGYIKANGINKVSIDILDNLRSSPFFLFINYNDAHSPYNPPSPYNGLFLNTTFPSLHKLLLRGKHSLNRLTQKERYEYLLSQYDGETAFLDSELGLLFSYLKKIGIYDSSLIILTSDHGELFGEHGLYWHRTPLYDGAVKVPLLIKLPHSKRTGREATRFTLQDVFPTILEICKIPIPPDISGKAFGDSTAPAVAELYDKKLGKHRALYDENLKYLWYEKGSKDELYDLSKDPREDKNIFQTHPEASKRLNNMLELWGEEHSPHYSSIDNQTQPIDNELKNKLKALGYVQ